MWHTTSTQVTLKCTNSATWLYLFVYHHETISVFFQKCFIAFLKVFLHEENQLKKIKYFSDGALFQYKIQKKTSTTFVSMKVTLGYQPSGIFSATSHGKRACEGIGGTVKRLAARASLQRPYNNQIMTLRQLLYCLCQKTKSLMLPKHF